MKQETVGLTIEAKTIHRTPTISYIELEGRFDAEGLPLVLSEIERCVSSGSQRFLIDLRNVSFIGSAGIGIFLSLVEELNGEGGGVVFINVPDAIQRIFEVLNVLEFLDLRNNRDEATNALLAISTGSAT